MFNNSNNKCYYCYINIHINTLGTLLLLLLILTKYVNSID